VNTTQFVHLTARIVGVQDGAVKPSEVSTKTVLVLVLPDGAQLQQLAKVVAGAVQAEIQTCNTPLGCLDLARKYKPQIALIHSSESVVENVSIIELSRQFRRSRKCA